MALGPGGGGGHGSALDQLFGATWPDPRPGARHPRLVALSTVPALLAALTLPEAGTGAASTLAALVVLAVLVLAHRRRAESGDTAVGVLVALLALTGVLTSSAWAVLLCWAAAVVLVLVTSSRARSVTGMVAAGVAVSMAWLRAGPWLRRSLPTGDGALVGRVVRTALVAVVLVSVFAMLFASADGVFARWLAAAVPDLGSAPGRAVVFGVVWVLVLSLLAVVVLPPDVERLRRAPRPPLRRYEWAVPVGGVVAVFLLFLLAQARALFGGAAYLQALGLSHATYVHQGFGQLVVASCLVLVVVGTAVRRAARTTRADRLWLQGLLCSLCLLALAVAASALHRLALYDAAYGASRLRLLVAVFEVWVVLVLVLAGTVCVRLRGEWVPRIAVAVGAVMLLGLALSGPDRVVAERNVDRYASTQRLDWTYLGSLSAEAVPALDRLPEPLRTCALREVRLDQGATAWDAATARARALLQERPVDPAVTCDTVPSR